MVVAHLTDVHISQLCINLKYNDFLLFSDELQLNIMIMLICYTLKSNALDSFQCRTNYIKFHLNPFKNQRARHDFPTLSSLLSNVQTRQTKIKVKITIHQKGLVNKEKIFKKALKRFLIDNVFYSVDEFLNYNVNNI